VLGVLDVTVSLDTMRQLLESYRYKLGALTFLTLVLLWASITLFMQFMINRPLKLLVKQTKELAEGKLDSTAPSFSSYEMGELSDAFNGMTLNLKKARVELEDWGHTLEQKVEERTDELKRIQGQLIRSEKLASLGELVAGIAHEINNPLTGILMFSSIMNHDKRLDPVFKNDVETIVRETERCALIVRGLLDFSRERKPQKKSSSINAIINATLSLVSNQSSFHDIEIIRDFSPDLPDMLIDPNQIEQVFVNLILNASHAMPTGGVLRLTTILSVNRSQASILISDTGCGIPPENLQRIFDPFFTTKENKGTGLGLSVSYGIVESHGGTIEVQSTVGQGTTFSIFLPVEQDVENEEGEQV
jgi:two-component system NtrC family sensor kinase